MIAGDRAPARLLHHGDGHRRRAAAVADRQRPRGDCRSCFPSSKPLAQRTYVYDAHGNEIAVYELENSQPIKLADIPAGRDPGVPRGRGQGVLRPPRRQRAQPRPGDAVELRRPTRRSRAPRRSRCRSSRTTSWPGSNATAATSCCRSTTPACSRSRCRRNRSSSATSTPCSSATTPTASRPRPRRTSARPPPS